MKPDRWKQVRELYHAALDREPGSRAALLREACEGDEELYREVESLLRFESQADSFMEQPAFEIAARALAADDSQSLIGEQIGSYKILSLLGQGGMGEVYLAQDSRLGRRVALKLLPSLVTKDVSRLRRFEQEARAASALNHPNIITIYEIGDVDGRNFLATEFIDGETLRQRIVAGPLNFIEALNFAEQMASALAEAHAAGIIHRDIKPDNIMLRRDRIVKVLDFGLAKLTQEKERGPEDPTRALVHTSTGLVMGTVTYMSPEQARGLAVDSRTDIWSLGVVLYEMIVGQIPFAGATNSDVLVSILEREPAPLSNSVAEVPPELQRIVSKALQKDREDRYQTIKDLRIDLKSLAREIDLAERDRKLRVAKQERITQERSGVSSSPFDSLAVLPFTISSASEDAEYLSDGITESVINSLAQLPQLKVMARSTVFRYKDQKRDPREIGRDLHVKAVLTGRVIPHGDTLIVSAELVNVADGSQLWGEHYKSNMTDIFDVQDEISTEISEKLRLKLTGEQQQKLTRRYTDNAEAYQLYLKGRYWWNKRTIDGMKKAVPYFEQAIETDPCYALAYAGLGDSYAMLGIYSALPPKESFPKAKIAQQRALEIDDDLAEAHASLGFTLLYHDWDLPQAEKELRHAIKLNPGYASAHQWLGFCLGLTYRTEEAIAEMNLAQQLDPFSASINYTAVWPVYWARRYDEAIRLYRAAVELHPDFWATHYWLGLAHEQKGEFAPAIAELEKAKALGDSSWRLSGLGHAYALVGRKSDAHEVLKELKALAKERYVSAYDVAVVYAVLDERDETFDWLEKAFDNRDWLLIWLGVDPLFDTLRADGRFKSLLRRIGFPQ